MNKLKAARIEKGLTQETVANMLGVTKRMYQYLESAERHPSWKVALKLEKIFGAPASHLLSDDKPA